MSEVLAVLPSNAEDLDRGLAMPPGDGHRIFENPATSEWLKPTKY